MKKDPLGCSSHNDVSPEITVNTAIILAGGLGTRLRAVVSGFPKAMAPVSGRPFLEYQLDYWIEQGISRFVISVGYRRDAIMNHFGKKYRGVQIDYAVEETPLGTGGGLLLAVREVNSSVPLLVLNGDTYFEVPLADLAGLHGARLSDWTFSLFPTSETKRYMGICVDGEGRILAFKKKPVHGEQLANGGVYLVNSRVLKEAAGEPGGKISLENEILPEMLARGTRLFGYVCRGRFLDIGLPEDYLRASEVFGG